MTRDDQDLLQLKAALRAAPASDPAAKAAALARAMQAFENSAPATQGSATATRSSQDRPFGAAMIDGVRMMLNALNLKPILAATTSAAALAVGVFVLLPQAEFPGPDQMPADLAEKPAVPTPQPATPEPAPPAAMAKGAAPLARQASPINSQSALADSTAGQTATTGLRDQVVVLPAPAPNPEIVPEIVMEPAMDEAVVVGEATPAEAMSGFSGAQDIYPQSNRTFAKAPENPVKITSQDPVSTFSIDVDTASYAFIRQSLGYGDLPEPEAVRIEEMINYFPYDYPAPVAGDAPFRPSIAVMPTPWNPGTRLVEIALQGRMPALDDRPPLNLVFLIDSSGSMQDANKLPLLKQSLGLMLGQLRPQDRVAIVAYAGSAGEVLPPTQARDKMAILSALDRLEAGGSTAGAEGLQLAYQIAAQMGGQGAVNRVLLATDGDFNVGLADPEALKSYIAQQRDSGIYLSVLGFGRENVDDAVMQSLAQNGNGTAAYIDTLQEAQKVLVDQLTGALFPIADDVKIQVEWNPAQIAEYRLIGYETRALNREDFNNDKVDAGEIGAGASVTALYEITPVGSDAVLNDPLRYAQAPASDGGAELGYLRLRYKEPGSAVSALLETPITGAEPETSDARFAAAIAGFGQLLRGSVYLGDWGWDQAIDLALANRGADRFGYRIEAINLMRLAKSLQQ